MHFYESVSHDHGNSWKVTRTAMTGDEADLAYAQRIDQIVEDEGSELGVEWIEYESGRKHAWATHGGSQWEWVPGDPPKIMCEMKFVNVGSCKNEAEMILSEHNASPAGTAPWKDENSYAGAVRLCWACARHEVVDAMRRVENGEATSFQVTLPGE